MCASLLSESLSLKETMGAAARAATEALDGDFALLLMPEGGRLAVVGSYRLPESIRNVDPPPALVEAAADGRVVAAPHVGEDERFGSEWKEAKFEAMLAHPVEIGGRGIIAVFFREPRAFGGDDLELA